MGNLYLLSDSQGRTIGVYDDLLLAENDLIEHAESFLDDVVIIRGRDDIPLSAVLKQIVYVEGFEEMGIEEVLYINLPV